MRTSYICARTVSVVLVSAGLASPVLHASEVDKLTASQGDPATYVEDVGGYSLGRADASWKLPLAMRPFAFRNSLELTPYPVHWVRHGDYVRPLPKGKEVELSFSYQGRQFKDIATFMNYYHTAGLIVLKDGKVVVARYRYGNTPQSKWPFESVTKSVVSTLVAAAIEDRSISSIDDQIVKYLPELRGSAYDGVTIRQAMHMSSGVDLHDVYETDDPKAKARGEALDAPDPHAMLNYIRTLKRAVPPGTRFSYTGIDPFVVGMVLTSATHKSMADYLTEKIWKPAGMEDDAYWRTDMGGQETGSSGLSATLPDMARFGQFALEDGVANGRQIVPKAWFAQVSKGDPVSFRLPGAIDLIPGLGYGYLWWMLPRGGASYQLGDDGGFAAQGVYGQEIYVVPKQHLVVAIQSSGHIAADVPVVTAGREFARAMAMKLEAPSTATP